MVFARCRDVVMPANVDRRLPPLSPLSASKLCVWLSLPLTDPSNARSVRVRGCAGRRQVVTRRATWDRASENFGGDSIDHHQLCE
jgi:hypothetical protein